MSITIKHGSKVSITRDGCTVSVLTPQAKVIVRAGIQGARGPSGGGGGGDVIGPSSSVNGNMVVFDGLTGKAIKDSGISFTVNGSYLEVTHNNITRRIRLTA